MTLKEYRVKNGYTQKEMANFLNIKQNSYSRKENGRRQFTIDELLALEKVFKISISDLLQLIKGNTRG
nr:MAG TPA: helix-turn-helix domain protein [Caudoviricetes sp.]